MLMVQGGKEAGRLRRGADMVQGGVGAGWQVPVRKVVMALCNDGARVAMLQGVEVI